MIMAAELLVSERCRKRDRTVVRAISLVTLPGKPKSSWVDRWGHGVPIDNSNTL